MADWPTALNLLGREGMHDEAVQVKKKSYYRRLGEMISKVKAETKWRDIFKIVEKAQKRINEKKH